MSEIFTSKHVERDFAVSLLRDHIAQHSATPVEQGENAAYNIGHALGYTDGLKYAVELLRGMPEARKPEPGLPYNHSR